MRLPTFITAEPPLLTPSRVRLAYAIAITTDALQFLLGPIGWAGADEILDVAATAWTGCVALVVMLRRRQQIGPPPPGQGPVIDV